MLKPLYQETAQPLVVSSTLDGAHMADVVVIGGGYTGLSTALHLASAGVDAVVLEKAEVGNGCSGRNGGQVNPGLKLSPDEVEAHWGADLGRRMNAMAAEAPDLVFELIERYAIDCAPSRTGTVRAAKDDDGHRLVQELARQSQARGGPVTYLDAGRIETMTGTSAYRGGAFDPTGGHVNPLGFARGLALAAQKAGARIFTRSPALNLKKADGRWIVSTPNGQVSAREIVIGTNGYTDDLWPNMRQSLIPIYSYIVASDVLPADIAARIMPARPALFELGWDVVYYRVDDGGRLLMGGRGPQRNAQSPADYAPLIDYARKLWPELEKIAFPWAWYGQVAVTKDHFPHLVIPEPGVHLMFGYNGRGVAVATAAGRMIAGRIASGGSAQIDLPVREGLDPFRFHRFWRVGATATIGWKRAVDRFTRR